MSIYAHTTDGPLIVYSYACAVAVCKPAVPFVTYKE